MPQTQPTQIRFRTDSWWIAQCKFKGTPWDAYMSCTEAEYNAVPPPLPGDIWRSNWYKEGGNGPLAGYAICCPKCGDIHIWSTATNCEPKVNGACRHSGVASCWDWTGSAEDGKLTASPSLLCHTCGYHGWLKEGVLTEC